MVKVTRQGEARSFSHLGLGLSILVEEEESIRRSWQLFFAERGLRLLVFESAEAFLTGFSPQGDALEFFFDQDFGHDRGVGLRLSTLVRSWPGRSGTSLVTSYNPEDFEEELAAGTVDAILPKFPEGIFGERYFDKHLARRLRETSHRAVLAESVSRVVEGLRRFGGPSNCLWRGV